MEKKNLKRGAAAALAAGLVLGTIPVQANASDITGHWAEETMKQWIADGLLRGDGENYRPNDPVSRAEFMAFTNRALGLTDKAPVSQFTDVKPGDWFYDDVAKALKAGYTNGTTATTMSPGMNITNQQMYAILGRLATEDGTADLSVVRDLDDVGAWAREDLEDAIANGYVVGDRQGRVNPNKTATRAQAVTILDRLKSDSRHFALPGVYTVKAKEVTVMDDGIILRDCVIQGDLILQKNVKAVHLDNTTVSGKIIRENPDTKVIEAGEWQDGTYEGIAQGESGKIRVQVVIKGGKITQVKLLEHKEDLGSEIMMNTVIRQIVRTGDVKDITFGNDQTINSDGVLNAVKDAVAQASGRTLKPGQSEAAMKYTVMQDGTYIGQAIGYGGKLQVEMTVQSGKITELKVLKHRETEAYLNISKKVLDRVAEHNGTAEVDTITGATTTSSALLRAADDAIAQALGKTDAPGQTDGSRVDGSHNSGENASRPEGQDFSDKLEDGTYYGQASGFRPGIKVTVVVKDKKITSVEVTDHNETPAYYSKAEGIVDDIVSANSTNVDTVTGATATSRGILSAVEDALKQFMSEIAHADGVWYGQGRGFYPNDKYSGGQLVRTASELSVTVENGKICKVDVLNHGDDERFGARLAKKFDVVEQYIIDHNGTDGLIEIMAKGDPADPVYDAVSHATMSARGYVAAIDDALRRSDKFSRDGIKQDIRSLTLLNNPGYTVPPTQFHYGQPIDLSGLKVLIKYRDGRNETVPFTELKTRGVECTLDTIFTPMPEGTDFSGETNYDLVFTDPISTAQHRSQLQASRMEVYREIDTITFTTVSGETATVKPNADGFVYHAALTGEEMNGIASVNVTDTEGKNVALDPEQPYELVSEYGNPLLRVNLKPLPPALDTDMVQNTYRYSTYKIKLDIAAPFNPEHIHSFNVDVYPKMEYKQGEPLDLSRMELQAIDSNYKSEYIRFADMGAMGFTIRREDNKPVANGMVLDETGSFDLVIEHANAESQTITITVSAKEGLLDKFEIRAVADEKLLVTIEDPQGTHDYGALYVELPAEYYVNCETSVKLLGIDTNGNTMNLQPEWYGKNIMVTANDYTYIIYFSEAGAQ